MKYTSITANMTEKEMKEFWEDIRKTERRRGLVLIILSTIILIGVGVLFARADEVMMSASVQESEMRACIIECGWEFK